MNPIASVDPCRASVSRSNGSMRAQYAHWKSANSKTVSRAVFEPITVATPPNSRESITRETADARTGAVLGSLTWRFTATPARTRALPARTNVATSERTVRKGIELTRVAENVID